MGLGTCYYPSKSINVSFKIFWGTLGSSWNFWFLHIQRITLLKVYEQVPKAHVFVTSNTCCLFVDRKQWMNVSSTHSTVCKKWRNSTIKNVLHDYFNHSAGHFGPLATPFEKKILSKNVDFIILVFEANTVQTCISSSMYCT